MKLAIGPLCGNVWFGLLVLFATTNITLGCGGGGGGGGAPAGPRAWLETQPASPGARTQAYLMISDAADVAGLDFDLRFDPNSLSISSVTKTTVTSNFTMAYNDQPAGSLAVSMARATGLASGTGSQTLLAVEFVVDQDAQHGAPIPLVVSLDVYNVTPSRISVQAEDSEIMVQ